MSMALAREAFVRRCMRRADRRGLEAVCRRRARKGAGAAHGIDARLCQRLAPGHPPEAEAAEAAADREGDPAPGDFTADALESREGTAGRTGTDNATPSPQCQADCVQKQDRPETVHPEEANRENKETGLRSVLREMNAAVVV